MEDEYNRKEDEEEHPCSCEDANVLKYKVKTLEAQLDRDYKEHSHVVKSIKQALGGDLLGSSADELTNIIASINTLRNTPGRPVDVKMEELRREAEAQRRNFEEQCNKVSRLESELRVLRNEKESLLYSIEIKDRTHRKQLEEANNRAIAGYEEVSELENTLATCHDLLDKYHIEEPDYEDETLPDRIMFLLKKLDPEYSEYLRLKEKFEPEED